MGEELLLSKDRLLAAARRLSAPERVDLFLPSVSCLRPPMTCRLWMCAHREGQAGKVEGAAQQPAVM